MPITFRVAQIGMAGLIVREEQTLLLVLDIQRVGGPGGAVTLAAGIGTSS